MNIKDAIVELALVTAGTITDRLIGYNPQISKYVQVPIGNGYTMNIVGVIAGAGAVVTPAFWKSPSNKYAIHFLTGMFADAMGVFGEMPYAQMQEVEVAEPEEQEYYTTEGPFLQPGKEPETKGPFLQKVVKATPKRNALLVKA